jgi:hypothetical protein
MRNVKEFASVWMLLTVVVMVSGLCSIPTVVEAQNNTVWTLNGGVATLAGSPAFIDASVLAGTGGHSDICAKLNAALLSLANTPPGAVIDARGITSSSYLTCPVLNGVATTPWVYGASTANNPATILLPGQTITIQGPWILPSGTRLVGPTSNSNLSTLSPFANDSTNSMIEMGSSSVCGSSPCSGISIEHMRLQANSLALGGIYNGYATSSTLESSYVNDVSISGFGATMPMGTVYSGLVVDVGAADSGPYSNLYFTATASSNCSNYACPPTACIKINAQTRGIHGITCSAYSNSQPGLPDAAIYLDASGNTIEDVHVEGFYDAVVVGDNANHQNAQVSGNTLLNINAASGKGPVFNTVHICAGFTVTNTACSSTLSPPPIGDLALFGIRMVPGQYYAGTPIRDDLNGVNVNTPGQVNTAANVGMYILGEQVENSVQHSRFTTAFMGLNQSSTPVPVPSWGVGTSSAPSGCNSTNMVGSLYSNTTGGPKTTIYVCTVSGWVPIA